MKLTIAKKLTLSFGLLIAITLMLGGYANFRMQEATREATTLSAHDLPNLTLSINTERSWLKTMLALNVYAYTQDTALLETGRQGITEVLATLKNTQSPAKEKILTVKSITEESVGVDAAIAADKQQLNNSARDFTAAAADFFAYQSQKLSEQISAQDSGDKLLERKLKLEDAQAIIDHANLLRLIAWKAIAERKVTGFTATKVHFEAIAAVIAKVRPVTTRKANLDQIDSIEKTAKAYAQALESYRKHQSQQDVLMMNRDGVVDDCIATLGETSTQSIEKMTGATTVTATHLSSTTRNLWLGLAAGVALGIILSVLLTRAFTRPIRLCVAAVEKLAQGDLTAQIGLQSSDELGILSRSFDTCVNNLRSMVTQLSQTAVSLAASSRALTETSHTQAAAAEQTTVQANTVASAGEELSINSKVMAESASHITQSTTTVAAAMEEMSSSIQEVARNCTQASDGARKADVQARQTRELMAKLDESARQIGKVVNLINRIAEQTNLLALNATIEAASAGEAGRGFAVVANEVKELARQSATATEDIRKQVAIIQDNTGSSIRSLDEVTKVIEQVAHISSSIAAAVEEQSATTSEIVGNIHAVSTATGALSKNVQQTAEGAAEVARNISGVSQAAADGAKGAVGVSTSATELSGLSGTLNQLVSRFKI